MPDFSLRDWILYWTIEFGFEAKHTDPETGDVYWIEVDDQLDYRLNHLRLQIANEREAKIVKEAIKLLHSTVGKGEGQIRGGSMTYWRLEIQEKFHIPKERWFKMSLKEKAMYIAKIQVSNSVATYQRLLNSS